MSVSRLNAYSPLRAREGITVTSPRSESSIEKTLCELLRKHGALCLKFVSPGNPGVPDRIVMLPDGRVVFVELKAERGTLDSRQEWQIERLRNLGADVRVLWGADQVREFVEEVLPA